MAGAGARAARKAAVRGVVAGDVARAIAADRRTLEFMGSSLALAQVGEDRSRDSWHSNCRCQSTGRGENIFALVSMKRQRSLDTRRKKLLARDSSVLFDWELQGKDQAVLWFDIQRHSLPGRSPFSASGGL